MVTKRDITQIGASRLPIKIICTVGPSSLTDQVLTQMEKLDVSMLRLNMSHTASEDLEGLIRRIRGVTSLPLCIDTEGAQVRTGRMSGGNVELGTGDVVTLVREDVDGNNARFELRPPEVFDSLEPGTLLMVDFNTVLLLVIDNNRDHATARVLSGGIVGSNKAVGSDRLIDLPFLTEKDRRAIDISLRCGIDLFALSFANSESSVLAFRDLVGPAATVISKVESRLALMGLDGIIRASDAILIDRGDLSRDVQVAELPFLQKKIIAKAHQKPIPAYVATNLLESMVSSPYPSRTEISDVVTSLLDGANGLVLAAETAIGRYPVRCITMIERLISHYGTETSQSIDLNPVAYSNGILSSTALPHGGPLTAQPPSSRNAAAAMDEGHRLAVTLATVRDIEQLASGTYSPLTGFMARDEINSVLDRYTLIDGTVWTLPIVLPAVYKDLRFSVGDQVVLVCNCCDSPVASLKVSDLYTFDSDDLCRRWFGTTHKKHPGVARLSQQGDCFIGGKVTLLNSHDFAKPEYNLSPAQVRAICDHNGWGQVVGFHTRNSPHRAHEFVQLEALEKTGADGLLIHPVLGQKKRGDFTQEAIFTGYEALINTHYPKDRVLLSGFFSNSWYAGPREAVFTAICRKNFGCSYFIVGRDHTGVGNFYLPNDVASLFDKVGDIGIEPIFFDEVVFDTKEKRHLEIDPKAETAGNRRISGTAIRRYISSGKPPPEWMMRPVVSEALLGLAARGESVFEA